jgi:protocatechuate 3,4-dioxygenase beta subunit
MTLTAIRVLLCAALGATLVHAQTASPAMPEGANVLLGRVVEVGTGAPVGGALVTLVGHFDASGNPATPNLNLLARGPDGPPSLSVMTTPDGYFVVRNLPAGLFTAATRAYGYMNHDFPPKVLEVRDGQRPTEVRLRVWKYAAFGGRVIDERGEPLAGMVVNALRRVTSGGGVLLRRAATGVTDDRGEYRLSQLEPGEYIAGVLSTTTSLPESVAAALDPSAANRDSFQAMRRKLSQSGFSRTYGCPQCISNSHEGHHLGGFVLQRPGAPLPPAPDGRPLGFANTFHPGASSARDAAVIALGSGESRTGVDLSVQLAPSVTVAGVLTGPDGPMTHVMLSLTPPGADLHDFEPGGVATAITDGGGAFAFLGVAPGDYVLSSSLAIVDNETAGEGRPFWATQPLSVGDADVAGLSLTMQPGVPISGRVEFEGVTDVTNGPLPRQFVSLQPIGAQTWRTIRAVVQPDGTFRSAGDPPGRYLINTAAPPGSFWQATSLNGAPVLDEVIELGSAELSGLVLTFGQRTNRVSGRVSGGDGTPAPDAAVIVFPADSRAWREGIFSGRRARKVYATSAGAYDITTLAPGDYYLAAVSAGLALNWQNPQFLDRLIAGAARVTLGAGEEKNVSLRTLSLSGR